jgi:hypothetical protein
LRDVRLVAVMLWAPAVGCSDSDRHSDPAESSWHADECNAAPGEDFEFEYDLEVTAADLESVPSLDTGNSEYMCEELCEYYWSHLETVPAGFDPYIETCEYVAPTDGVDGRLECSGVHACD